MITSAQIGSLSFNDNSNYLISEIPGLEMPPIRVANYNLAGEHFGIFVSAFYGKRHWSLRGWVVGSSINDFISKRDAFQLALDITSQSEKTVKFTLANGRQLQIDAVCSALDFSPKPGDVVATEFNIAFESSFPFLVSQTENSTNIALQSGGGGKVPPDTMPASLNADSGGKVTIVNSGNAIYYPLVRLSGPATNPEIKNNTTGKSVRLTLTLASGEYVDLDFKRKTIIDNQSRSRYSSKSGDWWFVQPGSNDIRFLADVYDPSALANIKYRDAYLGI